jgi:hypothetical protein
MSDANTLLPRPATDIDDVALGMIHLVVDVEFASLREALALALRKNHELTLLLEERRGDHRSPPRQAQAEGGPRGAIPIPEWAEVKR